MEMWVYASSREITKLLNSDLARATHAAQALYMTGWTDYHGRWTAVIS
jgi:hypothetical protein